MFLFVGYAGGKVPVGRPGGAHGKMIWIDGVHPTESLWGMDSLGFREFAQRVH